MAQLFRPVRPEEGFTVYTKRLLLVALVVAVLGSLSGCGRRCFCRDAGTSFRSSDPCCDR